MYVLEVQVDQLFEVGARWKHREQEILIAIERVVEPGKFTIRLVLSKSKVDAFIPSDAMLRLVVHGTWTSEDLLLHFNPMPLRATRYDLILEDDLIEDPDGVKPQDASSEIHGAS